MTVETIRGLLADGDAESAERTAHSLKGVVGTIGAGELQQRAQALEASIREGSDRVETHLVSVDEELSRMVDAVREALGPDDRADEIAEPEQLDDEVLARLPELAAKLKERRATARELATTLTINDIEEFAEEMKDFGERFGYPPLVSWSEKLTDAAGMFDMDAMTATLNTYEDLILYASDRANA